MSAESVYQSILDTVKETVEGLELNGTGDPGAPTVAIRKLPKAGESLDTLPMIVVSPSETPEEVRPLAFGGVFRIRYRVEITVIRSGNRNVIKGLDICLDWRQQIRKALQVTGAFEDVDDVYDVDFTPEVVIDRNMVNSNYDYSALGLVVTTAETAES